MIPATSFRREGDTALLVEQSKYLAGEWPKLNRPCDEYACNDGWWLDDDGDLVCECEAGCDGTGRHTFDIEVTLPCPVFNCTADHVFDRSFRVHVLDVLPIYGQPESPLPAGMNRWVWYSPWDLDPDKRGAFLCEIVGNKTVMTRITLPPDAATPGMFLVRLAVHQ